MRIVIDTNLFAAAYRKPGGTSAWVLSLWRGGGVSVLVSEDLLREYARVLTPPLVGGDYSVFIIDGLKNRSIMIEAGKREKALIAADPSDDKFLICAAEGKADYIVTSDQHLLEKKEFEGVGIVNPKRFRDIWQSGEEKVDKALKRENKGTSVN